MRREQVTQRLQIEVLQDGEGIHWIDIIRRAGAFADVQVLTALGTKPQAVFLAKGLARSCQEEPLQDQRCEIHHMVGRELFELIALKVWVLPFWSDDEVSFYGAIKLNLRILQAANAARGA